MRFFISQRNGAGGFTILETVVALGIMGLVVGALGALFGHGVSVNRQNYEQILITEDGRTQLIHMSDAVRNASLNATSGKWLEEAGENLLTINTNADSNADLEKVTYSLAGTELHMTVVQPDTTSQTRVLATSVRNLAKAVKLFTYYDIAGQELPFGEATSTNVNRIGVKLLLDVNPNQLPDVVTVTTSIFPRGAVQATGGSGSRLLSIGVNYPVDPVTVSSAQVVTPGISTIVWPIAQINARLTTYIQAYKVNINYQATTQGSYLPGWYAWVGPIFVGQSGSQKYYVTDQVPINELCLGQDFTQLLATCQPRTVSAGAFSTSYRPIVMYDFGGFQDYVGAITFTYDPTPAVSPTPTPTPSPVPELAYWKFDSGNSSSAVDSSANALNGDLKQGLASSYNTDVPTLIPASAYSLNFDGQNDHMVLPNSSLLNFSSDFTFSAWVKLSGTGTYTLLGGGNANSGYEVRIVNGKVSAGWNGLFFSSDIAVNNNAWKHIAVVFKASTIGVSIYIDGVNVAGGGGGAASITAYTGERRLGSTPAGTNYYQGKLDDVRLYNRALTAAEIRYLAQGNDL